MKETNHALFARVAAVVSVCVLVTTFTVTVLATPLNRNEHMYLAAAVLSQTNEVYGDFAFLQTPYLPIIYGWVFELTGGQYLLFTGRACSAVLGIGSAWLLYLACRRASGSRGVAGASVLVASTSKSWTEAFTESSNYALPVFATLLAFCLASGGLVRPRSRGILLAWFGVGLAMAIAVGSKLTYLPLTAPFLVRALMQSAGPTLDAPSGRFKPLCAIGAGLVVGLLPLAYLCLRHPEQAWFCNVTYHIENARLFKDLGGIDGRWLFFLENQLLKETGLLLVALILAGLQATRAWEESAASGFIRRPDAVLALGLALFGLAAAIIPFPSHLVYFVTPLPFLLILLSKFLQAGVRGRGLRVVLVALLVLSASLVPRRFFRYMAPPNEWTGFAVPHTAGLIQDRLGEQGALGMVATLSPLFALESGLSLYPEFATGPFLYRLNGRVLRDPSGSTVVGLSALDGGFEAESVPTLILAGWEPEAEESLVEFAEECGFGEVLGCPPPARLFLREGIRVDR